MRALVFINPSAGADAPAKTAEVVDRVRGAFDRAGIEAVVAAHGPATLGTAMERAAESGRDVLVVGGGDGTLNAGAAALVGTNRPLGILPLGTLNHFAKDVGIPLDLDRAVATIEEGHVEEVDVGEVNDRVFLNNSSIGLYPSAVDQREELRRRHGEGKWPAMFHACLDVFRRFPLLSVTLRAEGNAVTLTTPFVFVGNNRYAMKLFALGTRTSLQGGELSLYLTGNGGRIGLLRLAVRALVGRLEQDRDFHSLVLPDVEIRTPRKFLRVALDGEVVRMASPIRYAIRPRALRVLAPPPAAPEGA